MLNLILNDVLFLFSTFLDIYFVHLTCLIDELVFATSLDFVLLIQHKYELNFKTSIIFNFDFCPQVPFVYIMYMYICMTWK